MRICCLSTNYNSGSKNTGNKEKSDQHKDNALAIKKLTHANKLFLTKD